MTVEELQQKLSLGLPNAKITIEGDGCNCSCVVVSDDFEGVPLLNRQKQILNLVNAEIVSGELHALSIKARTNKEMEK